MAELLSDNPDVMASLLRALCDPGQITPRAGWRESMESWQRRAVVEHAASYIAAAEQARILALLDAWECPCGETSCSAYDTRDQFAALIEEDGGHA